MIKKLLYILILFSFTVFSQNDKLRVEIIDVFKEYDPEIINSVKISQQPTFIDTLTRQIISNKEIINKSLPITEKTLLIIPAKFRFIKNKLDYQKYLSVSVGNQAYLNTKFHYTSGFSTKHNSGIYFEHDSEAYLLNRELDGQQMIFLQAYSNQFLNQKILSTVCSFNRASGFYWADLESFSPNSVEKYIGNNVDISLNLDNTSAQQILNQGDVFLNYFSNNYGRHELFLHSSVALEVEQALRKYLLNLDLKFIHTIFNNDSELALNQVTHNRFSSLQSFDNLSDILISSKFLFSGNAIIDYNMGFNFQYLPNEAIKYGGKPLLFPEIRLSKVINNNQKVEFSMQKELIYHSFNQLFNEMPYIDPYYQNCMSKRFEASILYGRKINNDMSFSTNLHYLRERGSLIPFVFSQDFDNPLMNTYMNPLGIYRDRLQRGMELTSSFSIDKLRYNVLFDGTWSWITSRQHNGNQFVPKFQLNSIITLRLTSRLNVISNWAFVGKRDILKILELDDPNKVIQYSTIDPHVKGDITLNYSINTMTFSLELNNILRQKINFFDGYYDENTFKINVGFIYKF